MVQNSTKMSRRNFLAGAAIGTVGLCVAPTTIALAEEGGEKAEASELIIPRFKVSSKAEDGTPLVNMEGTLSPSESNGIEMYSNDGTDYEIDGSPTFFTDESGITHAGYDANLRIVTPNPNYNENSWCRIGISVTYEIRNGYLYMYRAKGTIKPFYNPYNYEMGIMVVNAGLRTDGYREQHYINQRYPGTNEEMWTEANLSWPPIVYMITSTNYANGGTTQAIIENQHLGVEVLF